MLWSYKNCQKIGVGKRLHQLRAKTVLAKRIADKILETRWNNPVKLNKRRNFW